MSEYKDAVGASWKVEIDGLLLAELREAGVDLVQDGLYLIEEREDSLTKAMLILCKGQREELKQTEKQFAINLRGAATDSAIEAVRGAAANFFRPSKWSAIQDRSSVLRDVDKLRPLLEMLNRPEMPERMKDAVMEVIAEKAKQVAGTSENSPESPSASGQDVTQLNAAGNSPETSVSIHAA